MEVVDFSGIISKSDVPVCVICGMPMLISEPVVLAEAEGLAFIVHWKCGDLEFFNA